MFKTLVLKNWRLIFVAALMALAGLFFKLWQETKAEYIRYGAGVEALGRQALEDKERIDREHQSNLKAVKHEYENRLPEVRAGAVAAYRAAHRVQPGTGQGAMPGITVGQQADDGSSQKQLSPDTTCDDAQFIEDAAQDALMLEQWRMWAIRNKIPVE